MSDLLVGLTIVAVGTSLPELVTSVVAAKKGENDIAIGNAVGSSLFNIVLILRRMIMFSSIALSIQHFAKETPDAAAFIINDEICTYAQLASSNRKAALYLQRRGIRPGDRVIVEADHTLAYVAFWYGIQLLGATFVPLEKGTPSKRNQ